MFFERFKPNLVHSKFIPGYKQYGKRVTRACVTDPTVQNELSFPFSKTAWAVHEFASMSRTYSLVSIECLH